jgi:hypothetical protein
MDERSSEKTFFEHIHWSIKISYFVASIIPLSVLVYFSIMYIYPYIDLTKSEEEIESAAIRITILLAVILSILGLALSSKAMNSSISSLKDLYLKLNSLVDVTRHFRNPNYIDIIPESMDVTRYFRETLYLDIFLKSVVESATEMLRTEAGSLLLFDEKGDLRFKITLGESGRAVRDRAILPGEGIGDWVAQTGMPAIVNNVSEDPRFNPEFDRESGFKTRSILCVPLIYENKPIGVLEVLNKIGGSFDAHDEKILFSLADQAAISIAQSKVHESQHSDMIHITEILIGALDYHIPEKKGHSRRVARYANAIGKGLGLSEEELKQLYYASLLHDIGLLKFDLSEYWGMKKFELHPTVGYEMVRPISLWKEVAPLILSHHERYDGKGYPHGKAGEEIPLGARIISVASTFDVLTSEHSYKKPLSFNDAVKEIEANSGTQFDPRVVEALRSSLMETGIFTD